MFIRLSVTEKTAVQYYGMQDWKWNMVLEVSQVIQVAG